MTPVFLSKDCSSSHTVYIDWGGGGGGRLSIAGTGGVGGGGGGGGGYSLSWDIQGGFI